ncbi:S-adenosyl-L-methionine-dependent methyltransferase [Syncephalis fuscata]|nr:S-adenosyl-L-methionine-dependent methyltransferase [Syncephalis fuscata]
MSSAGYSVSKSGSARSKGRASSNASSKEASISNNTESDKTTHSSSPSVKRFMVWYREVKGRRANSLKTFNNSDYVTVSDYGSSSEAHSVTSERGFARSENTIWIDGRERMVLDMNGHIAAVPSDSEDAEQSKTNHYVLRYVLRGNHVAALQNPKRILEVGTRTGLWTKEMAKEFPKAKITAIDIHDDVERDNWPSNAEFLLCDILSPNGLPFKDGHFDYVQMRTMRYFLPDETWPKVVSELYRVCKPGGLVELLEADFNFQTQTPETKRLMNTYAAVLRTSGVELEAIQHLDLLLELTGFTEIQSSFLTSLLEIGAKQLAELLDALPNTTLKASALKLPNLN